jgi:hypothetical protein
MDLEDSRSLCLVNRETGKCATWVITALQDDTS